MVAISTLHFLISEKVEAIIHVIIMGEFQKNVFNHKFFLCTPFGCICKQHCGSLPSDPSLCHPHIWWCKFSWLSPVAANWIQPTWLTRCCNVGDTQNHNHLVFGLRTQIMGSCETQTLCTKHQFCWDCLWPSFQKSSCICINSCPRCLCSPWLWNPSCRNGNTHIINWGQQLLYWCHCGPFCQSWTTLYTYPCIAAAQIPGKRPISSYTIAQIMCPTSDTVSVFTLFRYFWPQIHRDTNWVTVSIHILWYPKGSIMNDKQWTTVEFSGSEPHVN